MRVSYTWALAAALMAIGHVVGLQCSADPKLKKYSLDKVLHLKTERNTPPSTTLQEWYIDICDADREGIPAECNDDDMVCGLQWVTLPDHDPILTHVIHVDANKYKNTRVLNGYMGLEFKSIVDGDESMRPRVGFRCDLDSEEDEVTYFNHARFFLRITGPSGCVKKEYDDGYANDRNFRRRHSGIPWYWWFMMDTTVTIFLYCSVLSYLNTKGGSFKNFRDDFITRIGTSVVSSAAFIEQIVSEVLNRDRREEGLQILRNGECSVPSRDDISFA